MREYLHVDDKKMGSHHETEEHDVSQYPDPEQSGLNFPWLDQYRPVAAESLSTRLQPLIHEGYIPHENGSTSHSRYDFRDRHRSRFLMPEEEILNPSAVLEDSEEDPEFMDTDAETE